MLQGASKLSFFVRRAATSFSLTTNINLVRSAPVLYQSIRHFAAADSDVAKVKTKKKKNSKGKKKNSGSGKRGAVDGMYKLLAAAENAKRVKLDFTQEEIDRNNAIARKYQSECAKYNNNFHKDFALKIRLMQDALRAMPAHLHEQAIIIDGEFPPEDRPWARYDTPPIKGFNPLDYIDKKKK